MERSIVQRICYIFISRKKNMLKVKRPLHMKRKKSLACVWLQTCLCACAMHKLCNATSHIIYFPLVPFLVQHRTNSLLQVNHIANHVNSKLFFPYHIMSEVASSLERGLERQTIPQRMWESSFLPEIHSFPATQALVILTLLLKPRELFMYPATLDRLPLPILTLLLFSQTLLFSELYKSSSAQDRQKKWILNSHPYRTSI